MKYFMYCRKSSEGDEKQALSLQSQERELRDYAKENKLEIVKMYSEAKSARIPGKRDQFKAMLEGLDARKADAIICWKTDRLSRNPEEAGKIMQRITDNVIKEIRTPQKSIGTEDANDILMGVEFGSNSQFSKDLSYNTKRGIREKINLGQWPGLAPHFYVNYGLKNKERNIIPDPNIAEYYPKIVDEIVSRKLNVIRALDQLNKWGVKNRYNRSFALSSLHRILRDPIYYGLLRYSEYPEKIGAWEPLISKKKWLLLQDVLDDKSKPIKTRWEYPYNKLVHCARCGLFITGYTKVKKSGKAYSYYSCTKRHGNCGNPPIKLNDMENLVTPFISKIKFKGSILDELKKRTLEKLENEFGHEIAKREEISKSIAQATLKLDKILTMRLDEEITKEQYQQKKDEINSELDNLKEVEIDLRFNRDEIRSQLELYFEKVKGLYDVFTNGDSEDKRKIIYEITDRIELDNKKLRWNFKKPYLALIEVNSCPENINWGGWWDSNPRPLLPQRSALTS